MHPLRRPGPGSGAAVLPAALRALHPAHHDLAQAQRLGAAQISEGLVALPTDARTREHIDWIAEAGGTAMVWLAQSTRLSQDRQLAQAMADARASEYSTIVIQADQVRTLPDAEPRRVLRRLCAVSTTVTNSHPRNAPPSNAPSTPSTPTTTTTSRRPHEMGHPSPRNRFRTPRSRRSTGLAVSRFQPAGAPAARDTSAA